MARRDKAQMDDPEHRGGPRRYDGHNRKPQAAPMRVLRWRHQRRLGRMIRASWYRETA